MKIQEALEDFTEGGIMFPGPKTTYLEANTQNDGKTEKKGPVCTHMRLGHGEFYTHMHLGHVVCALCTEKVRGKNVFFLLFLGKSRVFCPNSGGNSPHKYRLPHS
jgi:hypothetical protein